MANSISSRERVLALARVPPKTISDINFADLASTLARNMAVARVRRKASRALVKKIASIIAPKSGTVWAFTVGIEKPANSITRSGSLPLVRNNAVDVTTNPTAITAKRSSRESNDLKVVRENHLALSFAVIIERLDFNWRNMN